MIYHTDYIDYFIYTSEGDTMESNSFSAPHTVRHAISGALS
jgi:hypothetical protein